jgi:hypothetical protein
LPSRERREEDQRTKHNDDNANGRDNQFLTIGGNAMSKAREEEVSNEVVDLEE